MRQAGRYLPEYRAVRARAGSFLDLCYTPELATEVTLQPVRRFGLDAAILFSDILVVPHGLGQKVAFREGVGPVLEPVRDRAALDGLHDAAAVVDRLAPVYRTVKAVAASLPEGAALIGFAGAPWTVATYMVEGGGSRDFAAVKAWAFADPAGFDQLIDRLVDATAAHLIAQVEAGAEALQLFDTWAGAVPAGLFDRLVIEPTARIVKAVRARHDSVPVIGFPRGAGLRLGDYAGATGVDAVGIDYTVPLAAAAAVQRRVAVQGNLDPACLAVGGAPMRDEVGAILARLSGGPFVFNLGHGILPATPPDNVARLVELVRRGVGG